MPFDTWYDVVMPTNHERHVASIRRKIIHQMSWLEGIHERVSAQVDALQAELGAMGEPPVPTRIPALARWLDDPANTVVD